MVDIILAITVVLLSISDFLSYLKVKQLTDILIDASLVIIENNRNIEELKNKVGN